MEVFQAPNGAHDVLGEESWSGCGSISPPWFCSNASPSPIWAPVAWLVPFLFATPYSRRFLQLLQFVTHLWRPLLVTFSVSATCCRDLGRHCRGAAASMRRPRCSGVTHGRHPPVTPPLHRNWRVSDAWKAFHQLPDVNSICRAPEISTITQMPSEAFKII